ncbi:DUF4998 domain-containing protein [Proteiniphilum sp.]|uniref:DUF4998 domain-containing protein n=1 Tax=Proteiniphilum sp. TaxID=1926877 RepID=UPI002B20B67E|nr:DUF4998 domain-containing protein [Proteiniphilum sp.]MEA4917843.1 DUF4998 domain-containing protein [Proteiniphilum sp.]
MKKIIYLLLITLITGSISSCKDMDDVYKEFLIPNGLKYPQRPDSLKIFAGYNRLRITWLEAKDPSITHAMIYWNNYQDSLRVNLGDYKDTITVNIENLGESTYTFYIKTFDHQGNISIPSEISGTSYGDNYVMTTTNRTISSAVRDANRKGTITWNAKTSDLVYTEVRYTTSSGEKKIVRALPEEIMLECPDAKPGELFEYRSVFLPKNGIDPIAKEWEEYDNPFAYKPDRSAWTAEARNGNHAWGDGGGGQTSLLFDGNKGTGWHSKVGAPFPQCVVTDMKESVLISYIVIYPPGPANWRYLKDIKIYLTESPIDANDPNITTILDGMTPVASATYGGGDSFRINFPTPSTGRYLTLSFPNSTSQYISFMELEVYGY